MSYSLHVFPRHFTDEIFIFLQAQLKRPVPKEYLNGGYLVIRVDGDSMDDGTKRPLSDGDELLVKEKN
jgi:hypothetical protein